MLKAERSRAQTTLGTLNYLAFKPTVKASYQAHPNAKIVCHNTFCRLIKKRLHLADYATLLQQPIFRQSRHRKQQEKVGGSWHFPNQETMHIVYLCNRRLHQFSKAVLPRTKVHKQTENGEGREERRMQQDLPCILLESTNEQMERKKENVSPSTRVVKHSKP